MFAGARAQTVIEIVTARYDAAKLGLTTHASQGRTHCTRPATLDMLIDLIVNLCEGRWCYSKYILGSRLRLSSRMNIEFC